MNSLKEIENKYPHYHKAIPPGLKKLDVYAVLKIFNIRSQLIGHAIKKLLCTGNRGAKNYLQDLHEARDSITKEIEYISIFGEQNE